MDQKTGIRSLYDEFLSGYWAEPGALYVEFLWNSTYKPAYALTLASGAAAEGQRSPMIIRTVWHFRQPPRVIWPLLCNARMEPTASCLFGLGVPQPEQCRLPEGHGGVGNTRQCVSDRGVIEQTILVWDEPHHLAFSMDRSDLYFRSCVPSIVDDFELVPTPQGGTRATRTTSVTVLGWFRWAKGTALRVGLKKVHRFVFGNWERLAMESAALAEKTASDHA
jgi:hypothetical protein